MLDGGLCRQCEPGYGEGVTTPRHIGARVAMADDQGPSGITAYDFEDASGHQWAEVAPPGVNLDVTPFVELDDGRRIETEPFAVSVGLNDQDTLKETIRESVLEDDVREVAESDAELDDWPFELDEIVAELARRGVRSDAGGLRALPFLLELDPTLEDRVEKGSG